jgi:hypothetical protein
MSFGCQRKKLKNTPACSIHCKKRLAVFPGGESLVSVGAWWWWVHRKKSFSIFPSPAGMSITKLSLGGNNDVMYEIFPPRESLVSDIPAGGGNIEKLFLR